MSYTPGIPSGLHRTLMRDRWGPQVDEQFGEMLLIKPMIFARGPNSQQEVDTSRAVITAAGVFRAAREPIAWGQADAQKQMIALDKPGFSIALAALPYALRRGDCIVRCQLNSWYAIKAMKSDGLKIRGLFDVEEFGIQDGLGGEAYA